MRRLAVCWVFLTVAATLSLAADFNGIWIRRDTSEKFHFEGSDSAITGYWVQSDGTRCSLWGVVPGDRVRLTATCGERKGAFDGLVIEGVSMQLEFTLGQKTYRVQLDKKYRQQ